MSKDKVVSPEAQAYDNFKALVEAQRFADATNMVRCGQIDPNLKPASTGDTLLHLAATDPVVSEWSDTQAIDADRIELIETIIFMGGRTDAKNKDNKLPHELSGSAEVQKALGCPVARPAPASTTPPPPPTGGKKGAAAAAATATAPTP